MNKQGIDMLARHLYGTSAAMWNAVHAAVGTKPSPPFDQLAGYEKEVWRKVAQAAVVALVKAKKRAP